MDPAAEDLAQRVRSSRSAWKDLSALCAFGGRFAGTESERQARTFLRERLAAIAPLKAHEVSYPGWMRLSCDFARVTPPQFSMLARSLVRSPSTPVRGIEREIVDLGRGALKDFEARRAEIAGRFVLVRHEFMFGSDHIHRRVKYQWALERGAAGFLIASHLPGDLLVTGSSGGDEIPAVGISRESAARLMESPPKYPRARLDVRAATLPATAQNLIAEMPGRTDEWVILCAHYDGHDLAQSAMDNASGVAAALTISEEMQPVISSLRRGLRVILFTIEEWGLMGSRVYVDQLSAEERRQIALVINLDAIVGGSKLTALTSGFEDLEHLISAAAASAGGAPIGVYRPMMANSDHFNFARHGIPALRLVSGFNEPDSRLRYLLTPGDTLDKIIPEELSEAAAIAAAMVYQACASETAPVRQHRGG